MRIDPILRALRHEDAPQRQAQAELEAVREAWKAAPEVAPVLTAFTRFGEGGALADHPVLRRIATDAGAARAFIAPLFEGITQVLARHPIGQVPFRHQYSSGISVMLLGEQGRATLSLVTYENETASKRPAARSVCFTESERYECFLSGCAQASIFEALEETTSAARLAERGVSLIAGETLALAGARTAKVVTSVPERLVMLRLSRVPESPMPAREYRLSDGALLHRASGDRRESREEMMLALLGRMGRADAAPAMEALLEDRSDHLRWQALRQMLALDTARGFAALCRIAQSTGDPLSAPAGALRAQLVESYPGLAARESEPCLVR